MDLGSQEYIPMQEEPRNPDGLINVEALHNPSMNPLAHSTAINPELFRSAGVMPIGPVSLWPKERHLASLNGAENPDSWDATEDIDNRIKKAERMSPAQATKVKASRMKMLQGLVQNASTAVVSGRVSAEVREERWATCQACPALIKKSNRCSDCGCFMQAKTWINGDPATLCPRKKWSR